MGWEKSLVMRLSAGSVRVDCIVAPPGGVSSSAVVATLSPDALGRAVVAAVSAVLGIGDVATGPIGVTDLSAPAVSSESTFGPTAGPQRSTTAQPDDQPDLVVPIVAGASCLCCALCGIGGLCAVCRQCRRKKSQVDVHPSDEMAQANGESTQDLSGICKQSKEQTANTTRT